MPEIATIISAQMKDRWSLNPPISAGQNIPQGRETKYKRYAERRDESDTSVKESLHGVYRRHRDVDNDVVVVCGGRLSDGERTPVLFGEDQPENRTVDKDDGEGNETRIILATTPMSGSSLFHQF